MKLSYFPKVIGFVFLGWFALGFTGAFRSVAHAGDQSVAPYQVAQDEHNERHHDHEHAHPAKVRGDEWYQGQRGHWDHDKKGWQWRGAGPGDDWYQGQRGHWYNESNGWQFGSAGLVCDNNCRNCRPGGYIPANGEGMVDSSNPSLCWSCDSDGHHCHWARRPRF
ncbi:MAG TPA: hypothetical protein VJN94_11520 [Candidatus Binataceae bacterium]|nr:hypothetical protein [Candidatus Binataceae bacterium]